MSEQPENRKWACPKERARFYSKQYQDRLRADGGEKHAAWLAARRASDAKRREARRAEREASGESARIRKMAEDVRKARVSAQRKQFREKVNAQIQHAGNAEDRRAQAKAAKATKSDAMAGTVPHDDRPDTEAFIRANPDKVIRLPPGEWSQPLRFTY